MGSWLFNHDRAVRRRNLLRPQVFPCKPDQQSGCGRAGDRGGDDEGFERSANWGAALLKSGIHSETYTRLGVL